MHLSSLLALIMLGVAATSGAADDTPLTTQTTESQPGGNLSVIVENQRRIVTDTPPGRYQAFPDVCRLANGELFVVFYAGYNHVSQPNAQMPQGGYIAAVRSSDEGQTWSKPEVVVDTPLDDRDPSACVLPDGTVFINFFTYHDPGAEAETRLVHSTDQGKTWSAPVLLLPGYATSTPIRRLRSGRLLLPVYRGNEAANMHFAAVCISDDHGKTWRAPVAVAHGEPYVMNEADLYERKDGTLLQVIRETMVASESADQGESWGPARKLGFDGHCPYLHLTPEGILLLATRLPQTELRYSRDEGRTWEGPVRIDEIRGAYPSMVTLKDGRTLVIYYEEGNEKAGKSAIHAAEVRIVRND